MSLKKLIENQTITIDDHKRGTGEIKDWNDLSSDVHIDKSTHFRIEGKRQKVRIKIPINSDQPIKIENFKNSKKIKEIPKQLFNEIKDALGDKTLRDRFTNDLVDTLKNFGSLLENEKRVRQTLERLSKHFDLNWTKKKIPVYINNTLQSYTEIYIDNLGDEFFMTVVKTKIEIGQNNGVSEIS